MRRFRISIGGLMAVVLVAAVGLAALRYGSEEWAALVTLMTLGLLALAILGTIYRRGDRRASWLGFALFGWGYMLLASGYWWEDGDRWPGLLTTILVEKLHPVVYSEETQPQSSLFDPLLRSLGSRDARVRAALDSPITVSFLTPTALDDVIRFIKKSTQSAELPDGIPIYIDPAGLQEAEQTGQSSITLTLQDVPLRTALKRLLRQLDLSYQLHDGLVTITHIESVNTADPVWPFLRIGHSLFALLAGLLGAVAGRRFYATRDREPASSLGP